jgi:hypothetical protein
MKRLIMAALFCGFVALLPNPQPADAQETKFQGCLRQAVYTCDEDFDPDSEILVAVRGWCYMIRGAICFAFD